MNSINDLKNYLNLDAPTEYNIFRIPYLAQRITNNTTRSSSGCVEWNLMLGRKGYGIIGISQNKKSTPRLAHRVSYLSFVGDIGKNWVLHKCDNPRCVNPTHLYLGDKFDNARDMKVRDRFWKGILTKEQELIIINNYKKTSNRKMAKSFGVSHTVINKRVNILKKQGVLS